MKKVLFINAINSNSEVEQRYPNLGLGYLVGCLRKSFDNDIFDFKIIDRDVENQILKYCPDIVGITCVSQNYNYAKKYANFAKGKNIPVIIGGVHISMLPSSLSEGMDIGCVGEGEETIMELFNLFLKENKFLVNELSKIKGLVFRKNGKIIQTEKRERIINMNDIPYPARDLLDIKKHSYMFTSRGCPYRCVFCASSRFWDNVRFFSAEYVVGEIKELVKNYGVQLISFFDDLFILDKKRLRDIVNLLKKQDFYKKVKFTCSCRVNLVDDETAQLLKEMNVVSVGLGLESGNERILTYLKGGSITVQQNKEAIKIFKKYKIAVNASFVIGSSSETKEEIMQTYNFIKETPFDLVDIYVLTPYPGTPIWRHALERGLVSDNMNWERLNVNFERNKRAIILSEKLSKEEIYNIYKKFRRLRLLKNLKNIWRHPLVVDLPRYVFGLIFEKINLLLKKS
ncbi:MAG: radical SAM protein [Patescibacteria group bacterium]